MEINKEIAIALEKQADHERLAATHYEAMALWCAFESYPGFSEFFREQAREEDEHTRKIQDHLLDRGWLPKLGSIPAPPATCENLISVIELAYKLECENTEGINEVYALALEKKDYPAQVLMHWFINEQVEEEAWASDMLAKIKRAGCAGALFNLDRHIMKIYAD